MEVGAFRSSLILTTDTAGLSRAADVTVQTISPGASFSAVFAIRTAPGRSGNQFISCLHDTTANQRIDLYLNSSGAVVLDVVNGGTSQASITGGTIAVGTEAKVGISIAANSFGLAVAGTAATRDTSGTVPTVTRICLGHDRSGANHLFGHIISGPDGVVWDTAKTDGQLATLTT